MTFSYSFRFVPILSRYRHLAVLYTDKNIDKQTNEEYRVNCGSKNVRIVVNCEFFAKLRKFRKFKLEDIIKTRHENADLMSKQTCRFTPGLWVGIWIGELKSV